MGERLGAAVGMPAGGQTLERIAGELIPEYREEQAAKQFADGTTSSEPDPQSKSLFRVLTIPQLFALPDPEWLIRDLLVANSFAVIYGQFASFKSFVALDWSLSLATGTPWCGRAVKQTDVLYVAGEGVGGLKLRVEAWIRHRGIDQPIPGFKIVPVAVNLMDPGQTARLIATVMEEHQADGFNPGLVVIDTLHRSMSGADENSAQDMSVAIDNGTQIQRRLRCAVLLVHHSGKDANRGLRGSTGLPGAADSIIRTTRAEDCVSLTCEKQKDHEDGFQIHLRSKIVTLIPDPTALEPRASLVLEEDPSAAGCSRRLLTVSEKAKAVLVDLIAAEGAPLASGDLAVPMTRWAEKCEEEKISECKERKHRTAEFKIAVRKLIESNDVGEQEGRVWIA